MTADGGAHDMSERLLCAGKPSILRCGTTRVWGVASGSAGASHVSPRTWRKGAAHRPEMVAPLEQPLDHSQ